MFDILFVRTFSIVGGMLLVTAVASILNKETVVNVLAGIFVTLGLLFATTEFRDSYPMSLVLLAAFSAWVGWMLGPVMDVISEDGQSNAITQALVCTAVATLGTGWIGMFSGMEFGFMKGYLSLALAMFVVFSLLNSFWWKSTFAEIFLPYVGSMIFVLYLLYDFDRLQKMAWDRSWWTAVDISTSLYLDVLNVFLNLLEIFLRASNNH